jgi:hypothetical protein
MSAVQSGGKGSGQRPGPGRNPTQAKRPPAQGKRPPAQGKRPPGKPQPGGRGAGKAGAPRQNVRVTSAPPRRFSPTTIAFVSVGAVVVIVVALVLVKVAGGGSTNNQTVHQRFLASAALVSQVTSVPDSVADAVGLPSGVNPPTVLKMQPPLTANGKPEVVFIGAEFCPLCGAERWAVIMTMSKFGTFAGLNETTSSPWDSPPAVSTFSFYKSTYTSQYIDFATVEHETNDVSGLGVGRTTLQPLTPAQLTLWQRYAALFGIRPGYPFMDFGNRMFVSGPSYDPNVLLGLSHQDIASRLSNPQDPVTQGIVGTSNYLTASVCALTGQQPAAACSPTAVHQAAAKLHLS